MSNKPKLPKIDIREDEIREAKVTADSYGDIVNRVVDEVVESACNVLDVTISEIQELLALHTPPIADLNYFIGYLPTAMYFVADRAEFVGIQMDSSSAIRREKYDELYALAAGKTIPDKEAETRKLVMNETVVEAAYKGHIEKFNRNWSKLTKCLRP